MQARCGAKTRNGGTCQNRPVEGRERCRMHGGHHPRGADHPNTKHGLYSKYLKERMQEKVGAFIDADPLDITGEVALSRAMLANWLEAFGDTTIPANIEIVSKLTGEIRAGALAIQKLRADTAITPAEAMVFLSRFIEAAKLYVPAEHWGAFVARCQSIFGGDVSPMLIDGHRDD